MYHADLGDLFMKSAERVDVLTRFCKEARLTHPACLSLSFISLIHLTKAWRFYIYLGEK